MKKVVGIVCLVACAGMLAGCRTGAVGAAQGDADVVTALVPVDAAHAPSARAFAGIPSVEVSPRNGRLWCTYYAGPTPGENHLNYCVLATSSDGGRTWTEVLVADPDGAGLKRAFDPELLVMPDGKLLWTWTERTLDAGSDLNDLWNGYSNDKSDVLVSVALDADNPPSAPYPPVRAHMRGVMMCKPTALRDGSWLLPLCEWNQAPSSKFYATRDFRDFEYRGDVTLPEKRRQCDEQQAVEQKDGTLRCFLRTKSNHMESFSRDGGRTWSEPVESEIGGPNTRIFVRRLASGNLLMVKHGKMGEEAPKDPAHPGSDWRIRKDLTAFVSRDDGKTWEGGLLLDAREDISYPDGCQDADGNVYVVYDFDRKGRMLVLLWKLTEEDILKGGVPAGKPATVYEAP